MKRRNDVRRPGRWLIRGGLMLIAAALFLTGYNLWDSRRAARASEQILEELGEIPDLELSLPVISEWSYEKLRSAPCRYAGSAYRPGFVIAAHNYSGHFGDIGRLSEGERVIFTDADGNSFVYVVREIQTLGPAAVADMKDARWDLTLFTCTAAGTARVTVRCERMVGE